MRLNFSLTSPCRPTNLPQSDIQALSINRRQTYQSKDSTASLKPRSTLQRWSCKLSLIIHVVAQVMLVLLLISSTCLSYVLFGASRPALRLVYTLFGILLLLFYTFWTLLIHLRRQERKLIAGVQNKRPKHVNYSYKKSIQQDARKQRTIFYQAQMLFLKQLTNKHIIIISRCVKYMRY